MNKSIQYIKNIETYTHRDAFDGDPMEVLMIGIDADVVGNENSIEPCEFDNYHLSTWLRKRYHITGGTIYAQIPRRLKYYPDVVQEKLDLHNINSFASDVSIDIEENTLNVYYPLNNTTSICLSWHIDDDFWTMKDVEQPNTDDNVIEGSGYVEDQKIIWSSP